MANDEDESKVLRAATIQQKTVQAGNSFMVLWSSGMMKKTWTLIARRTFYNPACFP
jgi:hypothetical protein